MDYHLSANYKTQIALRHCSAFLNLCYQSKEVIKGINAYNDILNLLHCFPPELGNVFFQFHSDRNHKLRLCHQKIDCFEKCSRTFLGGSGLPLSSYEKYCRGFSRFVTNSSQSQFPIFFTFNR